MNGTSVRVARGLRLVARVGAVASLVVLALFALGGNGSGPVPSGREWLLFACFPVGLALGLLVGLLRPRLGGAIGLLATGAFYLLHRSGAGDGVWPVAPWFALLATPAFLLFVAGSLRVEHRDGAAGS